jgi:hypothetical protein
MREHRPWESGRRQHQLFTMFSQQRPTKPPTKRERKHLRGKCIDVPFGLCVGRDASSRQQNLCLLLNLLFVLDHAVHICRCYIANIIMSLKTFAISLFIFAFFFWCWALKNTINMEPPLFDWGLVSFGSVLMTTSYLLALANLGKIPLSRMTRILAMSSHVLVALNYLLGAYLGFTLLARPGFGWYCIIFAALWLCIAGLASRLLVDSERNSSVGSSENQGLV